MIAENVQKAHQRRLVRDLVHKNYAGSALTNIRYMAAAANAKTVGKNKQKQKILASPVTNICAGIAKKLMSSMVAMVRVTARARE